LAPSNHRNRYALEEPLRIAQPNLLRLVVLDVPICENDRIHCIDILDALTKNFLGGDLGTGELGDLKKAFHIYLFIDYCLQCFDAVGWATGRASGL